MPEPEEDKCIRIGIDCSPPPKKDGGLQAIEDRNREKQDILERKYAGYKVTFKAGKVKKEHIVKDKIDCVTYHIYWNSETEGKIEKRVPKHITEGFENKYSYIYHDKEGKEHDLGFFNYKMTTEILSGNVKGKEKIPLIDTREFKGYESKDNKVKAKFASWNSESERWFINPVCLASLLGAMLDLNIDYLGFNGFSNYEGLSTGGSKSHISGTAGDLRYLSKNRNGEATYLQHTHFDYDTQVLFNKALYKYGWSKDGKRLMLSENFIYKGKQALLPHTKHYAVGTVRHYHHLHLQGFNFNVIKEIKDENKN